MKCKLFQKLKDFLWKGGRAVASEEEKATDKESTNLGNLAKDALDTGKQASSARYSYTNNKNKKCYHIVLSTRAYISIMAEVLSREPDETGGLLLGHYKAGIWYVAEATDCGTHAKRTRVYLEFDNEYVSHVYPVVSRLYEKDLSLLGLWHRHPGDFHVFSNVDHPTNEAYADSIGLGCLSFLVNRTGKQGLVLRCYFFDKDTGVYHKVKYEVNDEKLREEGLLQLADMKTLLTREKQLQEEIQGIA